MIAFIAHTSAIISNKFYDYKNQCKAYNSFIAMLRRENRIWIVFKAMVIGYCMQN